jgi:isoaspartyl peptidase/L-asparaginase-like protein (Ntn-hydrolase superfamily)
LTTLRSYEQWQQWVNNGHQPNYWKYPHNYSSTLQPSPNPSAQPPVFSSSSDSLLNANQHKEGLDTIGMVAIDSKGRVVAGTSTNGKIYKIPGRVGDSPIAGAGAYADAKGK